MTQRADLSEAITQLETLVGYDFDERNLAIYHTRSGRTKAVRAKHRAGVRAEDRARIRSYIRAIRILREAQTTDTARTTTGTQGADRAE
jgi:hypothetical protein